MARFFKHVGEHNGKKVVVVQRAIPEEEHMCSVVYSQIVPTHYHDDIMKVLESAEGQQANEFYEALMRRPASNGSTNLLNAIAREGYLKKAPTNQIIVKPNSSSSIRLDELNKLLREAGQGEEASAKLEELDRQQGYGKERAKTSEEPVTESVPNEAMSDADLAQLNIKQASEMKAQAETMLAEATRLEEEAAKLDPSLAKKTRGRKTGGTRTKKATA